VGEVAIAGSDTVDTETESTERSTLSGPSIQRNLCSLQLSESRNTIYNTRTRREANLKGEFWATATSYSLLRESTCACHIALMDCSSGGFIHHFDSKWLWGSCDSIISLMISSCKGPEADQSTWCSIPGSK